MFSAIRVEFLLKWVRPETLDQKRYETMPWVEL